MPILIVGTEKSFAALRKRLFAGKVPKNVADEVADAIREANPNVDLDDLQPGTVLSIPESSRVAIRGGLVPGLETTDALEGLFNASKEALQSLADSATARERQDRTKRRSIMKTLDEDAVVSAALKDKKLGADLAAVRETIAAEDGRAKERASTMKKAQGEWTAGLKALKKLLD